MNDVSDIFNRYEAIRHRMPHARFGAATRKLDSLLDIAADADAFVFDAYGVLNIGETPISGAAQRLDELRAAGKAIRILSNAASYSHPAAVEKFAKLGISVTPNEIVTSRDAAISGLGSGLWGCITAPHDDLADIDADICRLDKNPEDFDRVESFLFLSSTAWTDDHQAILTQSLRNRPRPVIVANADLVAPREGGFSLEPGHYAHLLADAGLGQMTFFGKPFPQVHQMIEATLPDTPPDRIVMSGDTLHTDILGAAARGWRTVLVTRDGLFSGTDTEDFCRRSAIFPNWRTERI
ncbi:HAD-IIA family hydrolase [Roseinatronobacter alkalisoli]|uniref:HAD-IIA family hydrolase n=1 Tax=Roseinatronobacter alkalisoli TaxID=3028235 RepID=A0ABT5TDM6_9RHOB|nr:HAD-IIA family hydrolase [Roseinatronobacter sp. HJB301]MDD7973227.1 HAD-IIA family hydrolase [Roseinatronobacter sp. HJB301]